LLWGRDYEHVTKVAAGLSTSPKNAAKSD